jgi:CheY-like chemotaxis protein
VLLRLDGYDVQVCYDGSTALERIFAWRPAVAVLELAMPGADGYLIAQTVRAYMSTEDIVLLALTGRGQEHEIARAFVVGFDAHRLKPADPAELLEWFAEHSGGRTAETQPTARAT